MSSGEPLQSRPYRSHKVPACTRCRSRKIRCHIDIPGEPCLACRERRLKCEYTVPSENNSPQEENGEKRPPKRRRHTDDASPMLHAVPLLHKTNSHSKASIMLAPHLAEDVDIFNRHIARHGEAGGEDEDDEPSNYQTLLHDARDPVVYLNVPRFRTGLPPNDGCGKEQLEIIEQLMGPFKHQVVELYFNHTHYHFPVLDNDTCDKLRTGQYSEVSNTLMCIIYCVGSPFWTRSDTLKMHPRPNSYYIWNKGISATLQDFLSPGMTTIQSAVLDTVGRPSVSIIGNITVVGQTLSLAQTFGLHRDPSEWRLTDNEKSMRIRCWWCVLINTYWSSVAYGTPPQISPGYYDVPKPTVAFLAGSKLTARQRQATTCFVHLCGLSELLGEILPWIFQINPDRTRLAEEIARFKVCLDKLEAQLPEWLPLPDRPGTPNLWLCFLSIRLVLARVIFRASCLDSEDVGNPVSRDHRNIYLRVASSAVLDFILSLGQTQFSDFWLPYVTHLLVHAITVSLRCIVEMQNADERNASIDRLERFMKHIQHARDNYDWDIAIYCIERCADPIKRIAETNAREISTTAAATTMIQQIQLNDGNVDLSNLPPIDQEGSLNSLENFAPITNYTMDDGTSFLWADVLGPNAVDFSWDALWDTPAGVPNFSI